MASNICSRIADRNFNHSDLTDLHESDRQAYLYAKTTQHHDHSLSANFRINRESDLVCCFGYPLHTTTSERKYHRLIRCLLCQQHNPAYYTCQSSYRRSYLQLASIRRRPDFIVQTGTEPRAEIHFAGSFTLGNASTIGNRMYTEFGQLFDQNRLDYQQKSILQKLAALQNPTGGWSWFKGMYPSRFMTANVLAIMARANLTGQRAFNEQEKEMQIKALRYLDNEIRK